MTTVNLHYVPVSTLPQVQGTNLYQNANLPMLFKVKQVSVHESAGYDTTESIKSGDLFRIFSTFLFRSWFGLALLTFSHSPLKALISQLFSSASC